MPPTHIVVSVVMPAYNRGYIIADAIRSVLAGSFQEFELIVVDDGSKDDTAQVVSQFRDPRIRCIRHEVNRGYSAACNTGIRNAQGELIAFLDSDDIWKPEKLAKDVDFLERHLEADAVFTDLEKQDGPRFVPSFMRESPAMVRLLSAKQWPEEILFSQREMYLCLLQEVPIKPSALVIRNAALKTLGDFFNEAWPSGSDWDVLLRFAKRFRFGYIDVPLTVLRVQSDATHRIHAVVDKTSVLEMLKAEVKSAPDRQARHSAKAGYCDMVRYLSWEYLKRRERFKAFQVLARGALVGRSPGLVARAAYALVRPYS